MAEKRDYGDNWFELAEEVRERDNWTCRKCGKSPSKQVHHIIPLREGGKNEKKNLITLCKRCHNIADNLYFKYGLRSQDKIWLKENENKMKIIVTGCQRSGTRFYSKYLAKEKGLKYVDENDYGVHNFDEATKILKEDVVMHAPALKHKIEEFRELYPGIIIYWLFRDKEETLKSMRRVWNEEEAEKEIAKMSGLIDFSSVNANSFEIAIGMSHKLGKKYLNEGKVIMVDMKSIENLPNFKKNNEVVWNE